MNIKYQFYRAYYDGFDVNQVLNDDEEANKEYFEDINRSIESVQLKTGSSEHGMVGYRTYVEKLAGKNCFYLKTTYPGLLIGSGYTHETGGKGEYKIGFYFDHTTGLPTIPGSSVKGVLRSVFPGYNADEIKTGHARKDAMATYICNEWPNNKALEGFFDKKDNNQPYENINSNGRAWIQKLEHSIFGELQSEDPDKNRIDDRDVFFDAQIVKSLNDKNEILAADFITPHGDEVWKEPTPLQFLKVLPQVVWEFSFKLHKTTIDEIEISAEEKKSLFEQILLDFGVGAKTNVGYGQFEEYNSKEVAKSFYLKADPYTPRKKTHSRKNHRRTSSSRSTSKDSSNANKAVGTLIINPKVGDVFTVLLKSKGRTVVPNIQYQNTDLVNHDTIIENVHGYTCSLEDGMRKMVNKGYTVEIRITELTEVGLIEKCVITKLVKNNL